MGSARPWRRMISTRRPRPHATWSGHTIITLEPRRSHRRSVPRCVSAPCAGSPRPAASQCRRGQDRIDRGQMNLHGISAPSGPEDVHPAAGSDPREWQRFTKQRISLVASDGAGRCTDSRRITGGPVRRDGQRRGTSGGHGLKGCSRNPSCHAECRALPGVVAGRHLMHEVMQSMQFSPAPSLNIMAALESSAHAGWSRSDQAWMRSQSTQQCDQETHVKFQHQ